MQMIASCPNCGRDAQWDGVVALQGGGTSYTITCGTCDGGMTIQEQYQRWLNKQNNGEGEAA
jgi:transcription elongation factor Elf1